MEYSEKKKLRKKRSSVEFEVEKTGRRGRFNLNFKLTKYLPLAAEPKHMKSSPPPAPARIDEPRIFDGTQGQSRWKSKSHSGGLSREAASLR